MNLSEATFAVLEELKRMREGGLREVYLEDETIDGLGHALGWTDNITPAEDKVISPQSIPSVVKQEQDSPQKVISEFHAKEKPNQTIKAIGVDVTPENAAKFSSPPSLTLPDGDKRSKWEWLEQEARNCTVSNSELDPDGQMIFGRGDLDSELFFCGEAPNEEDEKAGKAFGGPAGELLGKIIEAMGFPTSSVYISNILHWKPKYELSFGHRSPTQAEINFAMPFLKAQLEIVKPKVIVALGKSATDGFLGFDSKRRLGDVRGNWSDYNGIPLMVTYHPSYLLHNPSKSGKRKVWEDMLKVMEHVGASISEKQLGFFQ